MLIYCNISSRHDGDISKVVLPGLYATGIIFLDQNHEKVITLLLPQSIYLNQLSFLSVIISIHFRLTEIDFNFYKLFYYYPVFSGEWSNGPVWKSCCWMQTQGRFLWYSSVFLSNFLLALSIYSLITSITWFIMLLLLLLN